MTQPTTEYRSRPFSAEDATSLPDGTLLAPYFHMRKLRIAALSHAASCLIPVICNREGVFDRHPRPFVGWMMMVKDAPESRRPVTDHSPHFPVFKEFQGASYLKRYDILCQRPVQEQLYTTAAVLTSPRNATDTGCYANMSELTNLKTFVTSFAGHIAATAARG